MRGIFWGCRDTPDKGSGARVRGPVVEHQMEKSMGNVKMSVRVVGMLLQQTRFR